jgi:hypothetical protein
MTARHRALAALALAMAALSIALGAPTASGQDALTASVDRTRISTELGRTFVFRSTITNHSSLPADDLIAHLNIVDLKGDVYVDPEDWSTHRTRYLGPVGAGASQTVTWRLKAVSSGTFGVYIAVLHGTGDARPPVTAPLVAVDVAGRTTLNAGGIVPVALGVPLLLGLLTIGLRLRSRRA